MSVEIILDTTIAEPPMTVGEVEMLLFVLNRSRAQFAWKCGGLDAAGLGRRQPPSAMTLGGLLMHMAGVEDRTTAWALTGRLPAPPWDRYADDDIGWEWSAAAGETPEAIYGMWQAAVRRSQAALADVLRDGGLDQPVKVILRPGQEPNLRRVLGDLHDEYARHVGHADLLREAVDGLVGEDPPQPR